MPQDMDLVEVIGVDHNGSRSAIRKTVFGRPVIPSHARPMMRKLRGSNSAAAQFIFGAGVIAGFLSPKP